MPSFNKKKKKREPSFSGGTRRPEFSLEMIGQKKKINKFLTGVGGAKIFKAYPKMMF